MVHLKVKLILILPVVLLVSATSVSAHCPLCTLGAAMAAGTAAYFGVSQAAIGVFIGAFAVSIGWWISNLLKKEYFRHQRMALIVLSFLTTVFPLLPLMQAITPVYISWFGDYGSIFNRTYLISQFLVGSLIGSVLVCVAPSLSRKISEMREDKTIPYQGMMITFLLLIIAAIGAHFLMGGYYG